MKHILVVTGSRDANRTACEGYITKVLLAASRRRQPITEIWHGDCASGADMAAHLRCKAAALVERAFPADWTKHGKRAGPTRNREMMAAAAQYGDPLVLAMPAIGATNRGTMSAIQEALTNRLNVVVRWVSSDVDRWPTSSTSPNY